MSRTYYVHTNTKNIPFLYGMNTPYHESDAMPRRTFYTVLDLEEIFITEKKNFLNREPYTKKNDKIINMRQQCSYYRMSDQRENKVV